jgi:hypothetical protein
MAERGDIGNLYTGNMQNIPSFVHKLTADSITPGRMSLLIDHYGSMNSTGADKRGSLSGTDGNRTMLPPSVVPTPVLESPVLEMTTIKQEQLDDIQQKIKVG